MTIAPHEAPTRSRPLFEIGRDMEDLEAFIESLDGDISEPGVEERVMGWLAGLGGEQAVKLDGYLNLLRKWEGEAAAARAEEDRYKKARQVRENRVERLMGRLKNHMETTKQTKIETASGRTVKIQKNGGKLPLVISEGLDPWGIPEEFQKITPSVDIEAVRKSLEAGKAIEWAKLGERGTQIRIS